jgi:putative transposase
MSEPQATYQTYQIWIKPGHNLFPYFEELCFKSKNLYNTTNFYIRQVYTGVKSDNLQPLQREVLDAIDNNIGKMNDTQFLAFLSREEKLPRKRPNGKPPKENTFNPFFVPTAMHTFISYNFLDSLFKCIEQPDYLSLPTQGSQAVMKTVLQNWQSFFQALREYGANPEKFLGKPKIPGYCRTGRKEIALSNQDCVIRDAKYLKLPCTKEKLNIGKLGASGMLKQIRVIPRYGRYVVELVMEVDTPIVHLPEQPLMNRCMSLDLGVDNLATIVTNTGSKPTLVKGGHIKSINQFFNKERARLMSLLRMGKDPNEGQFTSHRIEALSLKRFLKIKDLFHKASYHIVQLAVQEHIDTIIIGQNTGWKQNINIGKRNNQTFCYIPFNMLFGMIQYKAERYGIKVIINEESYTSKASFLDDDEIPTYGEDNAGVHFSGKRIHRGLYRSANKTLINADVNGAANIMRKVVPNAFCGRDRGVVVSTPVVLNVQ